ncbi:hypothetical protein LTR10_023757 [Elasticomyces elasticus]|uniref:Arrestin-like N-terminal domain-containing protein n=1 Tax=Exophiala sideris TaxID=1016849 RepID=A0ABR0JL21_9EURO|nr:hypothetical protein LTR10_023757 [Elasticomyces elasticus]KAK5032216.1 hypothetical protein LTR13_007433 [Exophiala sideris]KAK5036214.1 hypothetical protein LTS07_001939 [Exophiala sideris]KAK5066597.1 hypothetical protein LTR69_001943 [Exophiala sideris]KAK5180419.1 hypothetical protein LTR44_007176 [Eurotiomycetes sp. CCFEE 6388]
MSTPTVQVVGISAAEESLSSLKALSQSQRLRLHGRISIFNHDNSFDQVTIRLQGAIRTKIGSLVAVENLSSSTKVMSNLDFKPAYSASRNQTEEQHLDFTCPMPNVLCKSSRCAAFDGFIPSMSLTGNTYVTQVTAISNRHLVPGRCDVVYWLEAEFLQSASNQVVRKIACPVDVSSLQTPLEAEVASQGHSSVVERIAKPHARALRLINSHSRPEVNVNIPKKLGYILSDSSRLATGCRSLSIPVSVNVKVPPHARRQAQAQIDSLECSVKAQWYTRKTFTTGPSAVESTVDSATVSTQRLSPVLPPLYNSTSEKDAVYTTQMELNLLLPESATGPSVSTDLLHVGYTLDLAMKFELTGNDGAKSGYKADFSLPVTLRTAQPESVISGRHFDPLLGYVEEDVHYAPPPYVY